MSVICSNGKAVQMKNEKPKEAEPKKATTATKKKAEQKEN